MTAPSARLLGWRARLASLQLVVALESVDAAPTLKTR